MTSQSGLIVLGGGPAGITAALQARELNATVTLLEADRVGGTSYNRGPAPVRTLARAARLARDWSSWNRFGLAGAAPVPNLAAILANSDRVAHYAHDKRQLPEHLRRKGVELFEGVGSVRFEDPHTLRASDGRTWRGDRIIVAVGGHAARLAIPGQELALTYADIRNLQNLPAAAAVLGAADTGCQIASILTDFGVKVMLFEAAPRVLPSADLDISAELMRAFASKGLESHPDTMVTALRPSNGRLVVEYRSTSSAEGDTTPMHGVVDAVFFAVGWPGNVDDLGLDAAGITAKRGAIPVDSYLRTNVENIYAVGDVNGSSMLVQAARLEGRVAAQNAILGATRQVAYDVVPSGSFTDPEYGRVGLTEAEATLSHDIEVGIARYDDLLRPVADGRPEGFCKLIADRGKHTILGAHVLGEYSAEIIQVVAACMIGGLTVQQIAGDPFAFPTFTEGVSMAAQKICRQLGIGSFPDAWSYLGSEP